jgi:hypothetical protein
VPDATLVFTRFSPRPVRITRTSGPAGLVVVRLTPGRWIVTPRPVRGLLGTAPPVGFAVPRHAPRPVRLRVTYDTGIR